MNVFEINPLSKFAGSSAAIRRPKEIAYFSYDEDHVFHLDDRSLNYYYTPRIGADLCSGFENFRQHDDSVDEHLDSLLKTIIEFEQRTSTKCDTDIVTWRGMMTKIMATPFDNMAGFEMNATRFQGTIFIEENHAYKVESRKQQQTQRHYPGAASQEMMSYWGYKFETLSLIPDYWDSTSRDLIEGRESAIVSNYAQYCSVVKTGIGKAKMVLGGEVDALWDRKPSNKDEPIDWVELKTSAEIINDKEALKYERKLLKFWAQSFLLGVPRIIVGFRSKEGILRKLEELQTKDIPGMVMKKGKGTWDGNLCINFTASFLDCEFVFIEQGTKCILQLTITKGLKQTITSEGLWRIRRKGKSPIVEVFKVEESGHGNVLSSEFLHWRNEGIGIPEA